MIRLVKFSEFLNESIDQTMRDFGLDERFEWSRELGELAENILNKSNELKEEYGYGRRSNNGFEFDIKTRSWPDLDNLASKYNVTEEEIDDLWYLFLSDQLEMYGEDIIENDKFFEDWSQGGRSGGWLILEYNMEDPDSVINDEISDYNYYTNQVDDEDFNEWKEFQERGGKGLRMLKSFNIKTPIPEDIQILEDEFNTCKPNLESLIEELNVLETHLIKVKKSIDDFWNNSNEYFNDFLDGQFDLD
jgi:spermidine/putrescine-binding protein